MSSCIVRLHRLRVGECCPKREEQPRITTAISIRGRATATEDLARAGALAGWELSCGTVGPFA